MTTTTTTSTTVGNAARSVLGPKICEAGGSGLWLPLWEGEQTSSKAIRGIAYGFLLLYFFQGASIVSDYFMSAIETITSRKKLVLNERTGRQVTILAWNSTVANLTLMALGSSAPEILLSVVEVFSRDFYSGDLGPSTIVGSAAFNLLIIIAICVCAIPSPEIRYIRDIDVFYVTAVFSVFAYLWLLLIVQVITPEIINIWEALFTIVLFPTLVYLSFLADKGKIPFCQRPKELKDDESDPDYAHGQVAHPRARSIIVQRMELEHRAAIEHEFREQKRGSIGPGRGSVILSAKTIMLPAGEPFPAGDDGEVLKDLKGNVIQCEQGIITFCRDIQEVMAGPEETTARVVVLRRNGTDGQVMCRYHSEKDTAIPGYDYREATGILIFEPGKMMNIIELTVLPVRPRETDEKFQLVLTDVEGGAIFNPNDDGGKDACVVTIIIKNDASHDRTATCFERACDVDTVAFGLELWREQVRNAFVVPANDEDEEDEPNVLDYIFHFVSLPWKAFYAFTSPPAIYCGGWILFFVALAHIALLTSIICDLASFFGCVLDIEDAVTAIIVVATGTSLPDLFASKSAALADDYADASIVNVTGSNSVNVFLGIGITWTICSIYWEVKGPTEDWQLKYPDKYAEHPKGGFVVKAGTLVYTVAIFNALAVMAVCVLRLKRKLFGGELGGPFVVKVVSSGTLLFFWVTYVSLSLWKSTSDAADNFQWILMGFAVMSVLGCIAIDFAIDRGVIQAWQPPPDSEIDATASNLQASADPDNINVGLIDAAAKDVSSAQDQKDSSLAVSLGKSSDENEGLGLSGLSPASPAVEIQEDDEEQGAAEFDTPENSPVEGGAEGKPKRRFKKNEGKDGKGATTAVKSENSPKKKMTKKRSGSGQKPEAVKTGEDAYGQPAARGQPDQVVEGEAAAVVEDAVVAPTEEGEGTTGT